MSFIIQWKRKNAFVVIKFDYIYVQKSFSGVLFSTEIFIFVVSKFVYVFIEAMQL